MQLTGEILDEFKQITSKDIKSFFQRALAFLNDGYNTITAYYSGKSNTISSEPFAIFNSLKSDRNIMFVAFQDHAKQLDNVKWWLVLEQLESIDSRLNTLDNINRWARSSATNVGYDPAINVSYTIKSNQTLERVSQDILKDNNPIDDWYDIAIKNNLAEEDYSAEGGTAIQLSFPKVTTNQQINSVVDRMDGKTIYGKDLDKKLQFDSATEDLKVLDYDTTVFQSVEILALLKQNDNPDSPSDGLQTGVVIGGNRALLNFPVITRQMTSTFAGDDSLKNFKITSISLDQDNVQVAYEVQTRLNETYSGQVVV